jgi:hypothetical protein
VLDSRFDFLTVAQVAALTHKNPAIPVNLLFVVWRIHYNLWILFSSLGLRTASR